MNSERFCSTVYIADFTEFVKKSSIAAGGYRGVVVSAEENGIIPSFVLRNDNRHPFVFINNENNAAVFTRDDGTKVEQCECVVYADRQDNKKGWMFFLELKYCSERARYRSMLDAIHQLKVTCRYLMDERKIFGERLFKMFLVVSTPGVTPLDPFDGYYFNQDDIISLKEETGAVLVASNQARIITPALLGF